jgi:hypothetical protein
MPLCLAVLLPLGAHAAEPVANRLEAPASKDLQKALLLSLEGSIVIETDGSVGEYRIATPTTPDIDALLRKTIPRWRFEPVLAEGKPVRAMAKMRLSLVAVESGKDYRVGIENVVFPGVVVDTQEPARERRSAVEATGRRTNPPIYPRALERAGVTGRVLLALHFAPDGHMVEVLPVQSALFNVRGYNNELRKAVHLFEQSAAEAARKWTVEVKLKPGAPTTERDFTGYATIEYVLAAPGHMRGAKTNDAPPGQWREATRTPKRAMPWLAGLEAADVGVADLVDGEFMPLAGGPKLKTPLAQP